MIHTIQLNDEYVDVKNLLKEIRRFKHGVHFENSTNVNVVPEGYMTIEEFRAEAKTSLTKLLNEHGIH